MKRWPKLVEAGLLPAIDDRVIAQMVVDFKDRHRGGEVDAEALRPLLKYADKLAGDYNRYSCDNSDPKSIIDQLVNVLEKARQENRFIPWQYVYADYSVSGLNPSRQGYSAYKEVLQNKDQLIETTYIDDFTRASRDEVEWWRLAYLSRRLQKRMIGAGDGFDLSSPNWDTMISVYGLLSRLFIKGLREKVIRGMRGAARRGGCLGKLSLGFTRRARRDDDGNVVRDKEGNPEYVPCKDPQTCGERRQMFELFADKCWSVYRITTDFKAREVDGWKGWTQAGIKKLLWSPSAIGVFIWNKTRREYDQLEKKWAIIKNPRRDWVVHYDPSLAIVPVSTWSAARKKLSAMRRKNPLTGRKMSRNENSATTLFSGTLFCGYCGSELRLIRSAANYKVMGCYNGPNGVHGCKLSASKSTRIIEERLLNFFKDKLLSDKEVEALVSNANAYLAQEAAKPRQNTKPLKASIRAKEASIEKSFHRIDGCKDEALIEAYEKRISKQQKEVQTLKLELRRLDSENTRPPKPLTADAVKGLIGDLRGLLNQEIPAAAESIRALTGPITIRQEKIARRKVGARWIATFSPTLVSWLRQRAKAKQCPDSVTLEYLSARIWITPETLEIPIDQVPKYERIADEVRKLADKGASLETISRLTGISRDTVRDGVRFSRSGVRPSINVRTCKRVRKKGRKGPTLPPKKMRLSAEVARLRDQEKLPFVDIAQRLKAAESTVTRAYDLAHQAAVEAAAEDGCTPDRGRCVGDEKLKERIRALLTSGRRPAEIARFLRCNAKLVYYQRRLMRLESVQSSAKRSSRQAKAKRHRAA
jgi:DNA invertase Pin-like site-specific DNA recombinase